MKYTKILIIYIVLALVSACASVPEMQKKLDDSPQSIGSLSDMQYLPLNSTQEQKAIFGEKSPTYVFNSGKNYYAAFSLPDPQSPKYLKLKSYLSSAYLPSASVLIPDIMLLDDKKQTVAILKDYRVDKETDFFQGAFFTANISLPANVSYLILYAATSHPQDLMLESENGKLWTIPLAPAGNIALTLSESLPANYDFSTAIIKDSANVLGSDKADIFYVSKVDGKPIKNSMQSTITGNRGRGMTMDPRLLDREIAANKSHTLTIEGGTHYAAPIQELFNKTYHVSGEIRFVPEKNKTYVVTGELGESGATVWIEEESTQQIVDRKIEGH